MSINESFVQHILIFLTFVYLLFQLLIKDVINSFEDAKKLKWSSCQLYGTTYREELLFTTRCSLKPSLSCFYLSITY